MFRTLVSARRWPYTVIAVILLLLIIQGMSLTMPDFLFPDAQQVLAATIESLRDNVPDLWTTFGRFLRAMALAIAIGWALGLLMGSKRWVGAVIEPMLKILTAMPAVSWILLAVLWMRDIEMRVLFVVFIVTLPFYAINVYEGVKAVDPELVQAVKQFQPHWYELQRYILIPNSIADVVITTKTMIGFSLRILVFMELLGANSGVGTAMSNAQNNFRIDKILALSILLIVITFLALAVVERLERWLLRWRPQSAIR